MRVVGVAALVCAVVLAGGFAVQWAALPFAGRGDVAAARAAQWLSRYREARSELALGGRLVRATCLRGWLGSRRGTLLSLADGTTVRDLPPHTLLVRGPRLPRPVATMEAAGCTKVLGDRLAGLAQFDPGVRARRVWIDGRPALAVDFPRLTLYVDARTGRPIEVASPWASGRIELAPVRRPPA